MMNKTRILITGDNGESLPPPYGGIMKRCLLHAKAWREYGSDVFIHVHHQHPDENDLDAGATYFYDYVEKPNLIKKLSFVFHAFLQNPLFFLRLIFLQTMLGVGWTALYLYVAAKGVRLDKEVQRTKPDIIVSETGGFPSLAALEVAKRNALPFLLENYAEIQYKADTTGHNIAGRFSRLWTYIVRGADLIVSASEHCAKGPLMYVDDPSKVKIIYSGINFDVFNSRVGREKKLIRKGFDLPPDRFIVMAVGSLKMRKGHDQLFEALARVPAERREHMSVVLCGMGDKDTLALHAAEMGFGDTDLKIFSGLSEEKLADLYSSADAFCFPSVTPRECMGMAMKEAMAIGLPIAAYQAGGISEAISEGENGFLAPVGDREQLADAIMRLANLTLEERTQMAFNNVEKAKTLFDIKNTAKEMYSEIQKLIKEA